MAFFHGCQMMVIMIMMMVMTMKRPVEPESVVSITFIHSRLFFRARIRPDQTQTTTCQCGDGNKQNGRGNSLDRKRNDKLYYLLQEQSTCCAKHSTGIFGEMFDRYLSNNM